MNETSPIPAAIGRLSCGDEQGTACYVGNGLALTCRHCVVSHLLNTDVPISIAFGERVVEARLANRNLPHTLDAVLLELPEIDHGTLDHTPLVVSHLPRGLEWTTFGFPRASRDAGMWLSGVVSQWVSTPTGPSDTFLGCDEYSALTDYGGFSGAPVIVDGSVRGFLQRQREGGLSAISLARLRHELAEAGVEFIDNENRRQLPEALADRLSAAIPNIQTYFYLEDAVRGGPGSYVLLAGSPGTGKSLVAAGYSPSSDGIVVLCRYFARNPDPNAPPPSYYSRPQVFAAWLSRQAMLFSEHAIAVSRSTPTAEAIPATIENLGVLGDVARANDQLGVVLIDDADSAFEGNLESFLHSLPSALPDNLVVVVSTTRPQLLRATFPDLNVSSVVEVAPLTGHDREVLISRSLPDADAATVLAISQESQGHPLLLTYLIAEAQDTDPGSATSVRDLDGYYESVWNKASQSGGTHWLLATLARLRGTVSTDELVRMMPAELQTSFPQDLRSVQHLLATLDGQVTFYHSSFADFVVRNTADNEVLVQERIATYCHSADARYAVANRLFHDLLSGGDFVRRTIGACDQEWANEVATRGVAPAWIMSDVDNVLRECAENGDFPELVRVLLLRSRLRFRYNQVFAEFAHEIAEAVLRIRGPSEALGYLERDGVYLCTASTAASMLRSLELCGEREHGHRFFEGFRRVFWTALESRGGALAADLQAFMLATCLGADSVRALQTDLRRVQALFGDDSKDDLQVFIWAPLFGETVWRMGQLVVPERELENEPHRLASTLAMALDHANKQRLYFGRPEDCDPTVPIHPAFTLEEDVVTLTEELIRDYGAVSGVELEVACALVERRCDPEVVLAVAGTVVAEQSSLRAENGVDASVQALHSIYLRAQVRAYTAQEDAKLPGSGWEKRIGAAAQQLGAANGRAHRGYRDGNPEQDGSRVIALISELLVPLEQRAEWDRAYHIPEALIPQIIAWAAIWVAEFVPSAATQWVDFLLKHAPPQLGLYTEGYRAALRHVIDVLGANPITRGGARRIEARFQQHVSRGVFNRRERISDLLESARAAAELDAPEMAQQAFRAALASSMGPSWYKEDQFALIQTALELSTTSRAVRRAVGLLELASGESTFQRFVRYHKQWLVRHIAQSGSVRSALDLFLHYVLPSPEVQLSRVLSTSVDKLDELRGGRFGVLEVEQQGGAVGLLSQLNDVSPSKLWAFVELFWPVDTRYFDEFAREARRLLGSDDGVLRKRFLRMLRVDIEPDRRERFLSAFADDPENLQWLSATQFALSAASDGESAVSETSLEDVPGFPTVEMPAESDGEGFVLPGTFGDARTLKELRVKIEDAALLVDEGDRHAAIAVLLDGLVQVRDSGWQIWRGSTDSTEAIEAILNIEGETVAGIRRLAGLIVSDQWTEDWTIAQTLVELALPRLSAAESAQVAECLFAHVEVLVGPEAGLIDTITEQNAVEHLASCDADQCVERLLIEFLDHPDWHTRARVADITFWLLERGELSPQVLIDRIATQAVGYGRELGVGLLDTFVRRSGTALNHSTLAQDPSCLVRSLLVPDSAVTSDPSAGSIESSLEANYAWPARLRAVLVAHPPAVAKKAEEELESLTSPSSASTMSELWKIRESGFNETTAGLGNPFEREAVARSLTAIRASHAPTLVSWNPHWPDADLDETWRPLATEIVERLDEGPGDHFTANGQTLLHCLELTSVEKGGPVAATEIMAVFVPYEFFEGGIDVERLFSRVSVHTATQTEEASQALLVAPAERAAHPFRYGEMVGGHATPAVPSSFATELLGESGYSRHVWRDGRAWRPLGPGRPMSQCVALTLESQKLQALTVWRLVWVVRTFDSVRVVDVEKKRIYEGH